MLASAFLKNSPMEWPQSGTKNFFSKKLIFVFTLFFNFQNIMYCQTFVILRKLKLLQISNAGIALVYRIECNLQGQCLCQKESISTISCTINQVCAFGSMFFERLPTLLHLYRVTNYDTLIYIVNTKIFIQHVQCVTHQLISTTQFSNGMLLCSVSYKRSLI